jgi:hypothetical protein
MPKDLYKGVFNWHGQFIPVFKRATSKEQARRLMIREIAQIVDTSFQRVNCYFDGLNYHIEAHQIGNGMEVKK